MVKKLTLTVQFSCQVAFTLAKLTLAMLNVQFTLKLLDPVYYYVAGTKCSLIILIKTIGS